MREWNGEHPRRKRGLAITPVKFGISFTTTHLNQAGALVLLYQDGTVQVTYNSWPLYTFIEDKKPGEDNGTDSKAFGASWYPLHPNGEKAGH